MAKFLIDDWLANAHLFALGSILSPTSASLSLRLEELQIIHNNRNEQVDEDKVLQDNEYNQEYWQGKEI